MTTSFSSSKHDRWALALPLAVVLFVAGSMLDGCSSDSKGGGSAGAAGTGAATCASPGGPESGAADMHCTGDAGAIVQVTGMCVPATGPINTDYGDPLYNTSGSDDDCKYDASYTVTPICENDDVTFTITATKRTDQSPLTGAKPFIEANIGTHAGLTGGQTTIEQAGGVYQIGPIRFDQPGEWTVRFHFFEECSDDPDDSPHGHIAFLVTVP